jgi:hypothetical protein
MRKAILLLAIGIAVGYWMGFQDRTIHRHNIVTRLVNRAGGSARSDVKNDPDQLMDSLDSH